MKIPNQFKITFLLDKKNNWIEPYLLKSHLIKGDSRTLVAISYDDSKVIDQDIVFVLGFTKILGRGFIDANRLSLVVHESDLPSGKGFSPVQWQILEGKKNIPICLIQLMQEVDSGNIIIKSKFHLTGLELYDEIRKKQAFATIKIIQKFLKIYPEFKLKKQSGPSTYYARRTAKDSELDIEKTINEQFNLLRIVNNEEWPCYFFKDNQKFILKIYRE
jgi:methionyl-tRNA formyltransferase